MSFTSLNVSFDILLHLWLWNALILIGILRSIIGRVAFTGKHQWVFGDGDTNTLGTAAGNAVNSRCMLEKVSKMLLRAHISFKNSSGFLTNFCVCSILLVGRFNLLLELR